MMDLSASASVMFVSFSALALSSISWAMSATQSDTFFKTWRRPLGILFMIGKTGERMKDNVIKRPGLTEPNESSAAAMGEIFPLRDPKSCENPPAPILSSLE